MISSPDTWYAFDRRSDIRGRNIPAGLEASFTHDPLADLDRVLAATNSAARPDPDLPFETGWIGYLSYELGREIEPTARHASPDEPTDPPRAWPRLELAHCRGALLFDHREGTWHAAGDPAWLETVAMQPRTPEVPVLPAACTGPWRSSYTRDAYRDAVERTLEYIRAGDIFQANITQRFSASFTGSTRRLAQRGLDRAAPHYGAYIEAPGGRTIVSMSPELFLHVDRDRVVTTRPIKGTRPSGTDERELRESSKDAAELHMIVDLMRNDLGRVCRFGSVRVPTGRAIESHPTVHHGVGEVVGRLRAEVTTGTLLGATFPPGSVTGAPKIRAMQIIDELEPVARGPYCGAIGYFADGGETCLNVAIRTIMLTGKRPDGRWDLLDGVADYHAGGGIVADSDPDEEYNECLDKAEVLRLALT